jgi:hypothetical protein
MGFPGETVKCTSHSSPNQKPLLCTANTWDDVKGPNNESLHIGEVSFKYKKQGSMEVTKFVNGENSPPPREVKAAMHLLLRLQLRKDTSDHLLHAIVSCLDGNLKNIGHTNKNFVQAFISMLNFNLTFNDFTYHSRPPISADSSFQDRCTELLKHNCKILLHYLRSTDPAMFDKLNEVTIHTSIPKIMESRRNYGTMMKQGLRNSLSKSEKKSPLWVHLAFLLQFICPKVNSILKTKITSNDDGCWSKFMTILTIRQVCDNNSTRGDAEFNIVAWKGRYDYQVKTNADSSNTNNASKQITTPVKAAAVALTNLAGNKKRKGVKNESRYSQKQKNKSQKLSEDTSIETNNNDSIREVVIMAEGVSTAAETLQNDSNVSPPMATIVGEAEDVSPPNEMSIKDDGSNEMKSEMEIVTSVDIKLKEPKDISPPNEMSIKHDTSEEMKSEVDDIVTSLESAEKHDEMVVLSPNLAEVRKQILAGTFSAKQQKKCSLSQAHQEIVGASSPCLRSTCHCRRGQCGTRCGCLRNKRACSSTCSCSGKCEINEMNQT